MKRLHFLFALAPLAIFAARCVSDDTVKPGGDASNDVTSQGDGAPGSDASTDAPQGPPAADGGLAWFQHFNTNFTFDDIAVNENGGPSFIVAGGYNTDPDAGGILNFGSQKLGPAVLTDQLLATLTATGPVWANSQAPGQAYVVKPACTAWQPLNEDVFTGVAVDGAGNIYVAGSTSSNVMLLKDEFPGPVSFVAAFSSAGTPLWDHVYSVDGNVVNGITDTGDAKITLAVQGTKVFAAFGFLGTLTFDAADAGANTVTSADSSIDVFVTALDTATGKTLWHTTYGSTNNDTVEQIVTTPQGEMLLTGTMAGTMTGPTGTGFPLAMIGDSGAGSDAYVVKLDGTGHPLYAFAYGDGQTAGGSNTYARSVAYANGVVGLAGYFTGAVDFGKGTITSQGGGDGFVLAWSESTKAPIFSSILAGASEDELIAVAVDPWGEVFTAGTYGAFNPASATLGTTLLPQTTPNVVAMVLAKYDALGKLLWSHPFMPTASDGGAADPNIDQRIVGLRIRATNGGQVAVAGSMSGGANFGSGYQSVLSTLAVPTSCGTIISGGNSYCSCQTTTADGFVGVWQP